MAEKIPEVFLALRNPLKQDLPPPRDFGSKVTPSDFVDASSSRNTFPSNIHEALNHSKYHPSTWWTETIYSNAMKASADVDDSDRKLDSISKIFDFIQDFDSMQIKKRLGLAIAQEAH